MVQFKIASFLVPITWIFPLAFSTGVPQEQIAHPGDNVTLKCQCPKIVSIRAVEWTRRDLEAEYVFLYRQGRSDVSNQHPSYTGRVELRDKEMKNGDLSLILKNVNRSDAGTYECRVVTAGTRSEPSSIILNIEEPGTMAKYGMDRDATERDAMERDATERDATERDAMERDPTDRDAMERDAMERDATDAHAEDKPARLRFAAVGAGVSLVVVIGLITVNKMKKTFPQQLRCDSC